MKMRVSPDPSDPRPFEPRIKPARRIRDMPDPDALVLMRKLIAHYVDNEPVVAAMVKAMGVERVRASVEDLIDAGFLYVQWEVNEDDPDDLGTYRVVPCTPIDLSAGGRA